LIPLLKKPNFLSDLSFMCDTPATLCNLRRLTPRLGATQETHMDMEPIAISVNSAAKALGLGRSSIYVLLKSGQLDAIKAGRRTLLTTASIRKFAQPQR
jgi:excisionase family DNA binding protein